MRPRLLLLLAPLLALTLAGHARPPAGKRDPLARYDSSIKPADRKHWAFRPVRPVAVPRVKDSAWVRNPIDAFVLARLEARGWKPAPPAARHALLRRVYLDLVGLPPTPQEVNAFLADKSPNAYEKVVDRLLASPHYGERWGRHWLDLARYADTNGYERDADKPSVWRWRDWVIRSLNADKPYDSFVLEQLAGDELPGADSDTVTATSFLRLGPWDDEPADPKADRFDQLDDVVSTTAQTFLGLTLACARCHDHKFEPLTMHDYYRAVAVFDPLTRPQEGRTEKAVPALPPPRRAPFEKARRPLTALRAAQAAQAVTAGRQPLIAFAGVAASGELARRAEGKLPRVPPAYVFEERSPRPPATRLLKRGRPDSPGPRVGPGVPAVLVARQPDFLAPDGHTTRRRLSLARWVASPDNPLTARVIVNRVWQHHFGEALVRTPSDFGTRGERPTHPELLDWLAGWFVREGWSLKKLHRLILSSNAYRMGKRRNPEYASADPEDRLLWRVPYRRLEAEVLRDSMLAVSGRLNTRMYGPGMYPPIPPEALAGHSDPDKVWKPSPEPEASRRTVYAHVKRTLLVPMVEVLDFCDTARSTARRGITTVAPQALTLFNGAFVNEQARHLAARLEREAGPDPARQVDLAYSLALARPPSARERARLLEFLKRQEKAGASPRAARAQVCRVILNLNEFAYPD
jgi:hypothetical protein